MVDDEGEASGYTSSATVSSVQMTECQLTWPTIIMMIFTNGWKLKNKIPGHSKKLWTIFNRCSLNSLPTEITMIPSNHNEEEPNDDEQPKTEKSKESSSIDAEVLKGIQAQIASLTQRDELKKTDMTRPYPLE